MKAKSMMMFLGILLLVLGCSAQRNETLTFEGTPDDARFLQHQEIKPSELPKPGATRSSSNDQRIYDHPAGARLHLPIGFRISVFADGGFRNARWLALAPNGDVFVSNAQAGEVVIVTLEGGPICGAVGSEP